MSQRYYWAGLRDHMHFQPAIVANASALAVAVVQASGGPFNAVHYRTADWAEQYPDMFVGPAKLAEQLLRVGLWGICRALGFTPKFWGRTRWSLHK